jgi:hypothetical protein
MVTGNDKWYGQRPNGKRPRLPRFSLNGPLHHRKKLKVFHPKKDSLPLCEKKVRVAAAECETRIRTLSEWLVCNVFMRLPYGTTGCIAAERLMRANKMLHDEHGINLPCHNLDRPLPKGAMGLQLVKELHDDGNACVIPGIWTSVIGDDRVALKFFGAGINHHFQATNRRFCWFYGWIPHKSEVVGDASIISLGN